MPETVKTNRLINETSPYLLQHAYNPVDWYPWGDEAFARALNDDKPVLVSIGYSACHWCHVMEHESFEDEAVAEIQNEHFINIKVDMEERPDVDQIYMSFVQLTTGRGGWPMNVFLTPDKRPFFGGTYFPPSPRHGMPSWRQILLSISEAYRERRDELETTASKVVDELKRVSVVAAGESLSTAILDAAFESFARTFDPVNGGFGGAPKFPPAMSLEFLLRYHHRTGAAAALQMVTHTLDKMARGGIYDQLGGGFHRYAVDAIWLVPHFEKMLYDNAQLARVYIHAYQVTGYEFYKSIATETLEYLRREMLNPSGGFYSSQDADSEGVEGKFFVWEREEIEAVLNEDAKEFCEHFDVSPGGNFEGKNILNVFESECGNPRDSKGAQLDPSSTLRTLPTGRVSAFEGEREKLFAVREKRTKPGRDEKVLTAWNGLALAAFADAAAAFGSDEYFETAKRNADFILENLFYDNRLLRTWKDGVAKLNGYIEDYANVADGLIVLYQTSGETRYLSAAKRLADHMIREFWDAEDGGFYFTSNDHEEMVVRNKDFYDNATPSGNSVAADVFLRLSKLTAEDRYEKFAVSVLRLVASQLRRYPQGFGRALSALDFHLGETIEIVLIGEQGNDLQRAVDRRYLPNAVIVKSSYIAVDSELIPLLKDRLSVDGRPTAYVCVNFVCERPVIERGDLDALLDARILEKKSSTA